MTEYEMILYLWDLLGSMPTSRGDLMDEDTFWTIHDYLYGDNDNGDNIEDDEDNEEEEIFGGDEVW